jgi:hypothetical protein
MPLIPRVSEGPGRVRGHRPRCLGFDFANGQFEVREPAGLFVQNNRQQGLIDPDLAVVFDEAEFSEFIHEEVHA